MVTRPSRGEIWWAEEPEIGRRPVLVISRDRAIDVLTWVLVAPVTRTVRDIPTEVKVDEEEGMPQTCAVTLDNIRPMRKALLTEWITTLGHNRMNEVCAALLTAVDCRATAH